MTSNFSTLVNSQSVSCPVLLKVTGGSHPHTKAVIHIQKLSSTPVHYENFKLRDERFVVVCGGQCRVINSKSLFNLSVRLLNGTLVF